MTRFNIRYILPYLELKKNFWFFSAMLLGIFVFIKNAWVVEDAYISLRSIEQLFAGNGPRWNPHERVQVYTSPFWYILLAIFRIFSSDNFINIIILSFILWVSLIFVLRSIYKNDLVLFISISLFTASTGFFDFTTSGLENILAYFVMALYISSYVKLFQYIDENNIIESNVENNNIDESFRNIRKQVKKLVFLYALLIFVRHDLSLILFPPMLYVGIKYFKIFTLKRWVIISLVVLSPFILFTLFSIIYYGFPFPNTAYAKLNTDISRIALLKKGIAYFYSSFNYDFMTLAIIVSSCLLNILVFSSNYLKYMSYGVILNLFYILYIGGDYMQGRFFSYAYMVSLIVLLLKVLKLGVNVSLPNPTLISTDEENTYRMFWKFSKIKVSNVLFIFILIFSLCYLFFYKHTPFNSSLDYSFTDLRGDIADERGYYFMTTSLYRYMIHDYKKEKIFPKHRFSRGGYAFSRSRNNVVINSSIGMLGYQAGLDKIIVDPLALSDPLLARFPVPDRLFRIGHFKRNIPRGYMESIVNNTEEIVDSDVNEFYKKMKIITQSKELFTWERFKAIFLMNIGTYKYLIDKDIPNNGVKWGREYYSTQYLK